MEEESVYIRADSAVEALRSVRNRIRTREKNNLYKIVGSSLRLASYIFRNKSFMAGRDIYRIRQRTGPIQEVKTFSRVLRYVLDHVYNTLKSRNVAVSELPEKITEYIDRETEKEKSQLEKTLEEIEIDEKTEKRGDRIYDLILELAEGRDILNGFYKDLGREIVVSFLEEEHFLKEYMEFEKAYTSIGKKLGKQPHDTKIDIARANLVVKQLDHQETMITNALMRLKKRYKRIN